jgi:hypothetical protein
MKTLAALLLAFLLYVPASRAQSGPEQGGNELELWSGGGHNVSGGAANIGAWNVGLRYGWIITGPHGPSILRGRFEYAVDVVPVFWVFQPTGTAYGFDLDPIALKWDFEEHHHVVPYFELSGGTLFTSKQVPAGISRVNFASGGAAGLHLLRKKYNWSAEIRFLHISDAGLTTQNPGVNTIQVRIGFGLFTQPK